MIMEIGKNEHYNFQFTCCTERNFTQRMFADKLFLSCIVLMLEAEKKNQYLDMNGAFKEKSTECFILKLFLYWNYFVRKVENYGNDRFFLNIFKIMKKNQNV